MTRFERALAFQHALGPKPSEVDRTPPHPDDDNNESFDSGTSLGSLAL